VIIAAHALIYSEDEKATRAFLRDVLQWRYVVDTPSAPDWLIFKVGPSEMGVHPNSWGSGDQAVRLPLHSDVSLICDDLEATVTELKTRGAQFSGEVVDRGFGLAIMLKVPGAQDMLLYQPQHETAYDL
jgi:catechol 2,3-dioxygenase-like lactoylglutathione lyase family enzyme